MNNEKQEVIMQTTKFTKYNNNYGNIFGRVIVNGEMAKMFIGNDDTKAINVVVQYDKENDCLIVKKLKY